MTMRWRWLPRLLMWAMARPSASAISAVIGCSLATPRTPSVPNSFRSTTTNAYALSLAIARSQGETEQMPSVPAPFGLEADGRTSGRRRQRHRGFRRLGAGVDALDAAVTDQRLCVRHDVVALAADRLLHRRQGRWLLRERDREQLLR